MGFAVGDGNLVRREEGRNTTAEDDRFGAAQRVRLQLDAVASEALSGAVFFEIGTQTWGRDVDDLGNGGLGGALGTDGVIVKVKHAYLDWMVPHTALHLRMGLQAIVLPNVAGGSAVLDADVAGITANYTFNENMGLTVAWLRPLNDNFLGWTHKGGGTTRYGANYLDNMDLLVASLPLTFTGVKLTPWVMYGLLGKYALNNVDGENHFQRQHGQRDYNQPEWWTQDGVLSSSLTSSLTR